MGWFFGTSGKKIYREKFKDVLREIPDLSEKEREYVYNFFGGALEDGLTKEELKDKIRELKYTYDDEIEPSEVEKIRRKLLEYL